MRGAKLNGNPSSEGARVPNSTHARGYFQIDLACAGLVLHGRRASAHPWRITAFEETKKFADAVTGELQGHPPARRRADRWVVCLSSLSSCHEVAAAAATTATTTVSSVMMSLSKSKLAQQTERRVDDRRARVRSHRLDSVRTGGSNYCWKWEEVAPQQSN